MTMALLKKPYLNSQHLIGDLRAKLISIYLEMTSIQKLAYAMMSMKTSGHSKNFLITLVTSFTNAQLQLLWVLQKFWSQEADLHQRKMQEFSCLRKMKFWTRLKWQRAEMLMQLQSVSKQYLFLADFQASKDYAQLKSIASERISGNKLLPWKTRDIILAHALSGTSIYMHLEVSLEVLNKKLTIQLKCTRLKRTNGRCLQLEWRILYGLAVLWQFLILKYF